MCRLISKEAEKFLGQSIIRVNKPGGSFSIAIAAIASSNPDGYTIGYAGHPGLFVVPLTEKAPYHAVKDLKQIMQFGYLNIAVTVKEDSAFKKFEDVVTYARQNPKKLTYGSAGVGSFGHLGMELIGKKEEGIVKKLEDAFTKAMKEPAFIKGMKDLRLTIAYRNSMEMDDYVA